MTEAPDWFGQAECYRIDSDSGFPGFDELDRTEGAVTAAVAAWDRWDAKMRGFVIAPPPCPGLKLSALEALIFAK